MVVDTPVVVVCEVALEVAVCENIVAFCALMLVVVEPAEVEVVEVVLLVDASWYKLIRLPEPHGSVGFPVHAMLQSV